MTRAPVDRGFGYSGVFADPDGHTWEIAWIEALDLHADGTVSLPLMTWDELRAWCLSLTGATETFPFEPRVSVFKAANGKVFAIGAASSEPLDVSVKCDPELAEALRTSTRQSSRDITSTSGTGSRSRSAPMSRTSASRRSSKTATTW